MWTVEYKVNERDKALTPTGIRADNARAAWVAFGVLCRADAISYEVAHAFGPPASLASIERARSASSRSAWPTTEEERR